MTRPELPADIAALLAAGTVIPAHPLALTPERTLDVEAQKALTRYYRAAGAGGIAVAVHTTQFEIRDPEHNLFETVLRLAIEVLEEEPTRPMVRVAGVTGPTEQAVAEARLARELGYHAVLLSPKAPCTSEDEFLTRARAVAAEMPVIGFYLQTAIGGPVLSRDYWQAFADIEGVVAVKAAPFDRYRTLELVRGVAASPRGHEVALYTGNDDAIIHDLLSEFHVTGHDGSPVTRRFVGGLLGQWAVGTHSAVGLLERVHRAQDGDAALRCALLDEAQDLTDMNAAVFDPAHDFAGVIAGVHEFLRQQGLMPGIWCLNPEETLSPGQAEEIARVRSAYPALSDDAFLRTNTAGVN